MKRMIFLIVLGFMLVINCVNIAFSQVKDPTLFSWINPTTNTDGSALTDLVGTILRCDTRSGVYDLISVTVNDPTVITLLVSTVVLADGQYFCAVFAFNIAGRESSPSNEETFIIGDVSPPPPPSETVPNVPTGFVAE